MKTLERSGESSTNTKAQHGLRSPPFKQWNMENTLYMDSSILKLKTAYTVVHSRCREWRLAVERVERVADERAVGGEHAVEGVRAEERARVRARECPRPAPPRPESGRPRVGTGRRGAGCLFLSHAARRWQVQVCVRGARLVKVSSCLSKLSLRACGTGDRGGRYNLCG